MTKDTIKEEKSKSQNIQIKILHQLLRLIEKQIKMTIKFLIVRKNSLFYKNLDLWYGDNHALKTSI